MRINPSCRIAAASACMVMFFTVGLHACSIPVFRYALEMWAPDTFEVLVFHRGPLSEKHSAILGKLKASDAESPANLNVETIDLSQEPPAEMVRVWKSQPARRLPFVVLLYPRSMASQTVVWAGPLTDATVQALLGSPVRRPIAPRVPSGDSAVWVFLKSGHGKRDEAAAKRLRGLLAEMEKTLELPIPTDDIKISFSMLYLARKDPAEQVLVNMLLQSEPDLGKHDDQPIAFPVFGRGRVLYALIGKGIDADTVWGTCGFIVGPCSCQVKAQNPGFDLLIGTDWEDRLSRSVVSEDLAPPLAGISDLTATGEPPGTVVGDVDAPLENETVRGGGVLVRGVLVVLVSAVAVVIIGMLAVRRARMKK